MLVTNYFFASLSKKLFRIIQNLTGAVPTAVLSAGIFNYYILIDTPFGVMDSKQSLCFFISYGYYANN